MSLDYFESQVEQVRAEAERLRTSHDRRVSDIDRDTSLSDEGRTQARAELREHTKPKLKELRAKEDRLIDAEINSLELRIDSKTGKASTDIIAFRDAQDRAERIETPDEAERILARAMRGGDTSLAHAVFRRAIDANWNRIARAFVADKPELQGVVHDLSRLYQFKNDTFARTVQYSLMG